jgi:hypothetical protein
LDPRRLRGLVEPTLRHLEGGEALDEEVACGRRDALHLLTAGRLRERRDEHAVLHVGHVQHAELAGDGLTPELVGRLQAQLAAAEQVAAESVGVLRAEAV